VRRKIALHRIQAAPHRAGYPIRAQPSRCNCTLDATWSGASSLSPADPTPVESFAPATSLSFLLLRERSVSDVVRRSIFHVAQHGAWVVPHGVV
jgi:hypothetical protein